MEKNISSIDPSPKKGSEQLKSHRLEIIVALIGLAGVTVTALISNLEKIFPQKDTLQVQFSGYHPTGDLETELRYFFEVSGARKSLEAMLSNFGKRIGLDENRFKETFMQVDEMLNELVIPVYSKYLTISEVQELNKFYSTPIMRTLVSKQDKMGADLGSLEAAFLSKKFSEMNEKIGGGDTSSSAQPTKNESESKAKKRPAKMRPASQENLPVRKKKNR